MHTEFRVPNRKLIKEVYIYRPVVHKGLFERSIEYHISDHRPGTTASAKESQSLGALSQHPIDKWYIPASPKCKYIWIKGNESL